MRGKALGFLVFAGAVTWLPAQSHGHEGNLPSPKVQALLEAGFHAKPASERLRIYLKARDLAEDRSDQAGKGAALFRIGATYRQLGQDGKAAESFLASVAVYDRIKDIWESALVLDNLGLVYVDLGKSKEAVPCFERSASLWRSLKDGAQEAASLSHEGAAWDQLGEFNKAFACFTAALAPEKGMKAKEKVVALNDMGLALSDVGKYSEALEFYQKSLDLGREIHDSSDDGSTYGNIGLAYSGLGENGKALSAYLHALDLLKAEGDEKGQAETLANIGALYRDLGNVQEELRYEKEALPKLHALGDQNGEADCLNNIGLAYSDLHQGKEAILAFQQALPLAMRIGDQPLLNSIYDNLGTLAEGVGSDDVAKKFFDKALESSTASGDLASQATALNNLGYVSHKTGRDEEALKEYGDALNDERATGDRQGESQTLENIAWVHYEAGRLPLSIAFGKACVDVAQSLRADIKTLGKDLQGSFKSAVSIRYRNLADWLAEAGRLAEAEQVLNLLKDEELDGFLKRGDSSALKVDLTPREESWLQLYDKFGGELGKMAAEREGLLKIAPEKRTDVQKERLRQLRQQADDAASAFQAFLKQTQEAFTAADAAKDRLEDLKGSEELQRTLRQLPNHPAAIYTLLTQDGVRLILSVPGLTEPKQAKTKITAEELNKKILLFRQVLTDPSLDPRPLGGELYDLLVRPVEADLQGAGIQSLMWSLDGTLRYLPMWALYDRNAKQYLIEKYPSSLFTPRTVDRLTADPHDWTGAEFGVTRGGQIGDAKFSPLPGVALELEDVHKSLGGDSPKLDDAFTYDAFRDALESGVRVMHLATHFRLKPGDDAGSFLLLGKGDTLSVDKLKKMEDGAMSSLDLLVLSACETEMGGEADGSEFEGFALLAQLKGAGSVLATLWPVSDQSTALLMGEFYRLRLAHKDWSKLEALRQAQLEMIQGSMTGTEAPRRSADAGADSGSPSTLPRWPKELPPYAHPYYWAPFVLTGNWR